MTCVGHYEIKPPYIQEVYEENLGRSLYKIFVHPHAVEGYLFKGYLPPRHKLEAPYNYLVL